MTAAAMRATDFPLEGGSFALAVAQLSTDYLNRYGEALMLLEMAPMDMSVVEDLKAWEPVGYREHFRTSRLRCSATALAGYEALGSGERRAFEELCGAMDRLIATVTALLAEMGEGAEMPTVLDVACEALRSLMGRATQFINANGRIDIAEFATRSLQGDIDTLFAV